MPAPIGSAAAALEALGVRRLLTSGGELRAWDDRDQFVNWSTEDLT